MAFIYAVKSFENPFQVCGGDADSCIPDGKFNEISSILTFVRNVYVQLSAFFMALFYRKVAKQNASSYLSLALSGAAYALAVSVKTHAIFLLAGLIVVFAFALYK